MGTNSSNLSSTFEIFDNASFVNFVDSNVFFVLQGLGFIYTLVCVFWLVFVIYKLIGLIRNRRSLINLSYLNTEHDYKIRIFMHRESILRYLIFLVFSVLRFYFLTINLVGIPIIFVNYQDTLITIAPNCTLDTWTFIGSAYDRRFGMIVLNITYVLEGISFSMMILLFGVSLFHLSFAVRNELRVKSVLYYILLGLVINLILMESVLIPYANLFGTIAFILYTLKYLVQ